MCYLYAHCLKPNGITRYTQINHIAGNYIYVTGNVQKRVVYVLYISPSARLPPQRRKNRRGSQGNAPVKGSLGIGYRAPPSSGPLRYVLAFKSNKYFTKMIEYIYFENSCIIL